MSGFGFRFSRLMAPPSYLKFEVKVEGCLGGFRVSDLRLSGCSASGPES